MEVSNVQVLLLRYGLVQCYVEGRFMGYAADCFHFSLPLSNLYFEKGFNCYGCILKLLVQHLNLNLLMVNALY